MSWDKVHPDWENGYRIVKCDNCGALIKVPLEPTILTMGYVNQTFEWLHENSWWSDAVKDVDYCPKCRKEKENVLD